MQHQELRKPVLGLHMFVEFYVSRSRHQSYIDLAVMSLGLCTGDNLMQVRHLEVTSISSVKLCQIYIILARSLRTRTKCLSFTPTLVLSNWELVHEPLDSQIPVKLRLIIHFL